MILEALPHCRARGEIDGSLPLRDVEKTRARGVNRVCLPLWAYHGVGFFDRNRTVFDRNRQKSSKGPRVHFLHARERAQKGLQNRTCAPCVLDFLMVCAFGEKMESDEKCKNNTHV